MQQRHITETEVEAVLANPSITYPGNPGFLPTRRVLIGYPDGRYIKVVVVEGTDPIEIVTVAD
jgi:hypothetical protein